MHVLVTAGPTREYLDDVRFLSNPSSGKMGFACARAAARAGHRVTLVTGPVELADPPGVKVVRVTTALEMFDAAARAFEKCDAFIATAAVSDYRPAKRFDGKLKKGVAATLDLVENPDILLELSRRKGRRVLVGFALEVADAESNALAKYRKKSLDYIVLNGPSSFGADRMDATVYRGGEAVKRFTNATKSAVAAWLVRTIGKP